MDNNNIINSTTDLSELEKDYYNWCSLPYKMRYRANDACIKMYNCTVPDLYARYKSAIILSDDEKNVEKNNIRVYEEHGEYSYDNYEELLKVSTNLQLNPYIIIIDPSVDNMEELNCKINSFNLLNAKNKRLSNDFSWQLWGYNVPNMYEFILNKLNREENEEDKDSSNIIVSEAKKIEDSIKPVVDKCNHDLLHGNILEYFSTIWDSSVNNMGIVENTIYNKCMNFDESDYIGFDKSVLPTVVPWFKDTELEYCKTIVPFSGSYRSNILEAISNLKSDPTNEEYKNKLLSLGWNPSLDLKESDYDYIRTRQANTKFYSPIDIKDINISKIENNIKKDYYPIYFVLGYPDTFNKFANIANYNKAGISFDSTLNTIYSFNGVDNNFSGFTIESLNDYPFMDVVVLYVDSHAFQKIKSQCIKLKDNKKQLYGFGSVYGILTNNSNKVSLDNLKLIYSQYIDMLLRMANIDLSSMELNFGEFKLDKNANIFKVYYGKNSDYNSNRVDDILSIISNKENKKEFLTEFCSKFENDSSMSLVEKIECINNYISISPVISINQ